jgi:hypothetical protein
MEIQTNPEHVIGKLTYLFLLIAWIAFVMGGN